jgi:tetratricopeptide (TPR) repeat protein
VKVWIAWGEGRNDEAIAFMRYAADEEDALGKHPVSPGAILPVRELLGDLYLELDRPADALAAYEQSLTLNPERYRAMGRAAAERLGLASPEGIWQNGYDDKFREHVARMRPGDRIAIKASFVQKHRLPFDVLKLADGRYVVERFETGELILDAQI